MDREAVHVDYVYRSDPFVASDALTVIALGVQFLQLFLTLIGKLTKYQKRSPRRCKKECQELQELLESIRPDVVSAAKAVDSCKLLGIMATPQESWLKRLETELLQVEKLTDKCAPRGWFKKLREGKVSKKYISAQLETLKGFASELPQMHGVLMNMQMTAETHQAVAGSRTRRIPSFRNHRNIPEFVPDQFVRYEARPYNSFRRTPSFRNYKNNDDFDAEFVSDRSGFYEPRPVYWDRRMPASFEKYRNNDVDAEFVSDRSGCYESRPVYWDRRMPPFENYRYHDADRVCVDGVYFLKVRECEKSIIVAQPIALRSYPSFGRVPVTNPNYMKHIESEYY